MVETAVVLTVFLLFIFGIFEYCRFLFMLQVTTNAAREGARYASVNVDKPSNFPDTPYNDGVTTFIPIKTYVDVHMGGARQQLVGYAVTVFPCDPVQINQAPPVIATKPGATAWNDASFGERIAVRVTGTFMPLLPEFLLMGNTIPINVVVTMGSEG